MFKIFFFIINIFIFTLFEAYSHGEFRKDENVNNETFIQENFPSQEIASQEWEIFSEKKHNPLSWEKVEEEEIKNLKYNEPKIVIKNKTLKVKSLDRAVTLNQITYPEISHYVPNGYISDNQKFLTASLRTLSKLRFCDGKNFSYKCSDGILNIDLNLLSNEDYSFNSRFTLQSISNRGTEFGEESTLGFKFAKSFSPNWSLAFGGENIIHLDNEIDLGRNFYLISSTFKELGKFNNETPSMLFLNFGIGSDFYGYKGNGFLWRAPCLGKPNLTGNNKNNCSWGPIGSIALAANDRLTFVNEWFGYGYGSGFSLKPFKEGNIILSIYATDYIKGFPKYAQEHCPSNNCEPRYYGNISLSF